LAALLLFIIIILSNIRGLMASKPRRKPKKIYKTVIKLTPGRKGSDDEFIPEIDIDTVTLRPKLIKSTPAKKSFKKRLVTGKGAGSSKFKVAKRYNEALIQRMEWVPVTKKTRWKCIRCGWCCTHEWRVNLTWDEYDRLKDKLPIDELVMDKKTGMSHPFFTIKDKCYQYDPKTNKCKIYKERAYSCATYPFSLTPDGKLVRSKFCKGFGHGEAVDRKRMLLHIRKWRRRAGMIID
jgi:Fe-S-cluster containining protein